MYNDVLQYWLKQFNNTLKLPIQTNSTTLLALPLSALQFRRPAGVSQSLSQAHSFQHTTHRQTRSCQLITPDTPVHSNTSPPDRHINSNTSTLDRPVLHYNTPCRRVHSNNHPLAHPIIPTNHPLIDPFIPTHHLLIEPLIPTHHLLIEPLIPTHHPLTHPFIQTHYPVTNPFISTHRPPPATDRPVYSNIIFDRPDHSNNSSSDGPVHSNPSPPDRHLIYIHYVTTKFSCIPLTKKIPYTYQ